MNPAPKSILTVALVQPSTYQHDVTANLANLEEVLATISHNTDIVVLPEMFNTGFTNDVSLSERSNQQTHRWMCQQASRLGALLVGSVMWREGEVVTNRMLGITPDGQTLSYDKHHLFSLAGEGERITPGQMQVVWQYKGWAIRPIVCYDLRFPEWLRRTQTTAADCYLVVANWPASRQPAWDALLAARAIENQAYLVGVNRAADPDGHPSGLIYGGGSAAYHPEGHQLAKLRGEQAINVVLLSAADLQTYRSNFPFWQDADGFGKV